MDGFRSLLFKEAARSGVAGAFETFIDREITIPKGIRSRASVSHNRLREILDDENANDTTFPRILSAVDDDFLGGSFARHTKIWPLDDIDIYLPLDGAGLVYTSPAGNLPYQVQSDDASLTNPLLAAPNRWMVGSSISSRKLISEFAAVLREHYPTTTRVRHAGEAVTVTLSSELGFDVVPCFSLAPWSSGENPFYLMPDGNDGWLRTNPRIDTEVSGTLQERNGKTHRRAGKLLKWWNDNRFGGRFDSYYVELAIMRDTASRNQYGVVDTSVSVATAAAFNALSTAAGNGDLSTWIAKAPPVEAPTLGLEQRIGLAVIASNAAQAVAWEQSGSPEKALEIWKGIFGERFPTE